MNNRQIADIFENIADLSEMKGQQRYTVVAYQKVAPHYRPMARRAPADGA